MRRVQGLQIMTQTSSSVTSRLDSVFDGPAAPVTTSLHPPQSSHGSPVECLMAPYRPHSLSEASGWMEERGESSTKVKKDESWRRRTGLMMTMDGLTARLPGCQAVWFISFQTDICNFPQHPMRLTLEACRVFKLGCQDSKQSQYGLYESFQD